MDRNLVYVFDVAGADAARLDDEPTVRRCLDAVVRRAGLTPVGADAAHRFTPQGLSVAVILAESHVAVHTWPERGTAYVTLTTCRRPDGDDFADATRAALADVLGADRVDVRALV